MIKYKLECKKCTKMFDSWFSSSKEYDRIKKLKLLNCSYCNSKRIDKTLMAPNLISKNKKLEKYNTHKIRNIKKQIQNYQKFIKKHFRYVGDNFSYEARSIHYSKKNNKEGIYGTAKREEIEELRGEGIFTQSIPWVNDKEN